MTARGLVPEYTINGSFGEVRDESGLWLANVQEVTFRVVVDRSDVMLSGTRRKGYKATGVSGEGNIRQFKVTSAFARRVSEIMRNDRQIQFQGQLMVKLNDPEALGSERVLLQGVKFWEINGGWTVGELVEEDVPFTFHNMRFPNTIEGDMLTPLQRYQPLD